MRLFVAGKALTLRSHNIGKRCVMAAASRHNRGASASQLASIMIYCSVKSCACAGLRVRTKDQHLTLGEAHRFGWRAAFRDVTQTSTELSRFPCLSVRPVNPCDRKPRPSVVTCAAYDAKAGDEAGKHPPARERDFCCIDRTSLPARRGRPQPGPRPRRWRSNEITPSRW
jgi:hypothetical protein